MTDVLQNENGVVDIPAQRAALALKREAYIQTRLTELRAEYTRIVASYQAAIGELERVLEVGEDAPPAAE